MFVRSCLKACHAQPASLLATNRDYVISLTILDRRPNLLDQTLQSLGYSNKPATILLPYITPEPALTVIFVCWRNDWAR
jgi:hypothetical protein